MRPFLIFSILLAFTGFGACAGGASRPTEQDEANDVSSLQVIDVTAGNGTAATAGRTVTVHYTGWLYSEAAADHHGRQFDSSRQRNQPFSFVLGTGQVIAGWDQGVVGMKVGGQRTLVIPSPLGYGSRGVPGTIPANAALVFDVELLDVR